ncbi:MAG: hypothetical protein Q9224_005686 [Gallowayella concinna]
MLWHLRKEEFVCDKIFGKQPQFKGAVTGEPNDRIWVIWTHRYYGHPQINRLDNTLYILRVVIEKQSTDPAQRAHQVEQMRKILWAAQTEAAEWDLRTVKLWDPGYLLQDIIERTGIQHRRVEREDESIASLMWFGEGSGKNDMVEWLGNENRFLSLGLCTTSFWATMDFSFIQNELPDSNSPNLDLTQATPKECAQIWTNSSASWRDSLTVPVYLQEQLYLSNVPLARNGGMTTWILVEMNLPPDHRRIFCSCEAFPKRSLMSCTNGKVEDVIVHGIASVFCPLEYRRRGYAARHMKELAKALQTWQSHQARVVGSVLYSDIGKAYYANLGWKPNASNWHMEFPPMNVVKSPIAQDVVEDDLGELCRRDEAIIRDAMAKPTDEGKKVVTILPDLDHMLWHIAKEDFATKQLFGQTPRAKGVIAGLPGRQVWAIWTHRYYMHHNVEAAGNVLYILRLVVEGDETANKPSSRKEKGMKEEKQERQVESLIAVLQCAQAEAAEWQLDQVKLWEPTPWVEDVITKSHISHRIIEREEDSVASCLWFNEDSGQEAAPQWINNEHYAWC